MTDLQHIIDQINEIHPILELEDFMILLERECSHVTSYYDSELRLEEYDYDNGYSDGHKQGYSEGYEGSREY